MCLGFPRDVNRLYWFQTDISLIHVVVYLKCSDGVLRERLAGRGRADDNGKAIQQRLDTFYRETLPVLEAMEELQGQDARAAQGEEAGYFEVDGEEEPDVVEAKIIEVVKKALNIGE